MSLFKKVIIWFALMFSISSQAATIVVNSTNGGTGGSCSLANAIIAANNGTTSGGCTAGSAGSDEIVFDSS